LRRGLCRRGLLRRRLDLLLEEPHGETPGPLHPAGLGLRRHDPKQKSELAVGDLTAPVGLGRERQLLQPPIDLKQDLHPPD